MFDMKEIEFFIRLMNNLHIDTHLIPPDTPVPSGMDRGLRDFLKINDDYKLTFDETRKKLNQRVIYKIYDSFYCGYFFMILPDESFLSVGPYLYNDLTQEIISRSAAEHSVSDEVVSQLIKYFGNLPLAKDENCLIAAFSALGETVWGGADNFSFETIRLSDCWISELGTERFGAKSDDSLMSVRILEERYAAEAQMMKAISQGLTHKVERIFGNATNLVFEKRSDDPVRNMKNYLIISNTLFRKAAESGSVHPFYIDGLSTDYAYKIEQVKSVAEAEELIREMVQKYCALVKKYSMKNYSVLVQRVLTVIDSDLTADLGLKKIASMLNVNSSYLSSLFKKETGKTLTDYVNGKRIDHAAYLLRTTNLQVQAIAQQCGIFDVNYFAKMFKKFLGKTPKDYRKESKA